MMQALPLLIALLSEYLLFSNIDTSIVSNNGNTHHRATEHCEGAIEFS